MQATQKLDIVCNVPDDPSNSLVTVVINTFNQENLIGRCLEGVLSQEPLSNLRVLIIDDASTDQTIRVCKSFQERFPEKIEIVALPQNELSKGIFVGLSHIQRIKSEYIAFCDGDDYWVDNSKIKNQILSLEENEYVGLVHSDYYQLIEHSENSEIKERPRQDVEKSARFQGGLDLVKGNHIKNSTMMIRTSLLDFNFLSNSRGIYANDWLVCVSVTKNYKVSFIPHKTAVIRITQNGIWNGSTSERNIDQKMRVRWYCASHLPNSKLRDAFIMRVLIDWIKAHISKSRPYKLVRPVIQEIRKAKKPYYRFLTKMKQSKNTM